MAPLRLSPADRDLLEGRGGDGPRLAMRLIAGLAQAMGAPNLLDVTSAHIDGCLYHGQASLDFALRLAGTGARVRVPATLNVGSLDLLHPGLVRADPVLARDGRRLMELYVEMGCEPTWTCAPYQLPRRPGPGEHVAWAESNAIVFANSVLGARTDRYGDFVDVCAAVTGRVPDAGLHRPENRRGEVLFDLGGLPTALLDRDVLYPVLGHLVGLETGPRVPVLVGLPPATPEDRLKALGAAAASSGSVGLFHAVGVTPEAPSLDAALQGRPPLRTVRVSPDRVRLARDELSTAAGTRLSAVSVGTPHFSPAEFGRLMGLLDGFRLHPEVEFFVSTSRHVLDDVAARGWLDPLERAGIRIVVDTCTYVTPVLRGRAATVMTNSGKWAFYAPGNLGVDVAFGSLEECVRSAELGRVWHDDAVWDGV